ncbi:Gmad2 immunoglobulin-like domain-containing protein [Patescibacteria group bacterium]|nr:Gmad2 immunoglobulin-like domain-containing protein [Patescibacteria group bacterium]
MSKTLSRIFAAILVIFIVLVLFIFFLPKEKADINLNIENSNTHVTTIENFDDCIKAGNPAMESYPRQCMANGKTFVENIGNEQEKTDLIRLNNPRPNQIIASPLEISGEARGYWFFEATFPVVLTNWDGLIIAESYATAQGEWMTENFVPFTATLEFEVPNYKNNGSLILQKDNPSGLPENDDALEIPVILDTEVGVICKSSSNCEVPMRYAVQSNCPYQAFCENSSCVVACPMWEHSPDPKESKSYQVECSVNSDCDCKQWPGEYLRCVCLDGQCAAIVED